ncbi:hypothetical protein [Haloferula sargassicola]|uniref:hypothetical protein n=1 Tax=Haloferula sargassicola TaxID=490096 RepID=UPI00336568AD
MCAPKIQKTRFHGRIEKAFSGSGFEAYQGNSAVYLKRGPGEIRRWRLRLAPSGVYRLEIIGSCALNRVVTRLVKAWSLDPRLMPQSCHDQLELHFVAEECDEVIKGVVRLEAEFTSTRRWSIRHFDLRILPVGENCWYTHKALAAVGNSVLNEAD